MADERVAGTEPVAARTVLRWSHYPCAACAADQIANCGHKPKVERPDATTLATLQSPGCVAGRLLATGSVRWLWRWVDGSGRCAPRPTVGCPLRLR